ncbi:PAS domain S-box protein [Rhodospirillaceae bacterium AH-315-P19]|nr:PAS domain S-box protein [Rhodospirillaceae bacterium AH-315-P19]
MKISQKDPGLNETREERQQRNEGERRLRSIVDATPLPLFITSATDGRVLYANAKTETLTGLPPAALCGRKARDFYAKPEERDALFETLEKQGLINDHQVEMRKLTGETITVLLSLHPVIYENDLAILTSAINITERLRSEEALRESEERFRSAFEMAPHGIALVDLDGKWLKVNHALSEMIGYSETELKTTDFQAITHPDDLEASLACYKQMLAGEITTYQTEKRYLHKDGHVVWALLAVSLVRDSKDAPLYFVAQIYDLTARRQTEEALLESNRRLQGIFDHSPLLVSIRGIDERYRRVSKSYETFYGIKAEDLIGKTLVDRYAKNPEFAQQAKKDNQTLIETGTPQQQSIATRIINGKKHNFLVTKFLLRDAEGKPNETCGIGMDITKRQQAEEALLESNRRLEGILNYAPFCVSLKDLKGRYKWINSPYKKLFGVTLEEIVGKTALEIWGGNPALAALSKHTFKADLESAESSEPIYGKPFRQLLPDGQLRDFQRTKFVLRDENDQPTEICSISTDVTESQAMEKALRESESQLRESEARFRNISERAPVAISINRISDGTFLYVNPRTNAFYGFGPGELVGKQSLDLYQDPEERAEIIKLVLKTGHLNDREVRLKSADGTPLTAIISYARIAFDDEDAVMTVAQDVSELKKIETALRESQQRFRAVVEGLPLPLLIARLSDGQIIFANSRVGPALGLPAEKIIGAHAQDFYQNPEERRTIIERTRKHGGIREHELNMKKADGTPITVLLSIHPVTFRGEEAVLAGFQDITAFKKAEETFLQATKMDAIGQLAGGIVHDFNNLLGVIIGNLELLEERSQDEAAHNFARRALGAADRGAALTQRLLAFSRKQALEPKSTDLNRLISGMTELFEHSLAKTIEILTDPGDDLWPILIDPNQLESVILNLSLNAQDAMPKGGKLIISSKNVTIDAKTKEVDLAHGRYVLLTVRDNGVGIETENLAHVFDPFFTTKDVGKGSGLGLSVVYGFIRQSNGDVHIESNPGEGTTVKIYLPTTEKKATLAETDLPILKGLEGNGETILIVEDNVAMRTLAKRLLTGLNYRVLEAKDAPSALRILETVASIDLLFSDVVLPHRMNGVTLAKEARQNHPGLKILLTSGYLAELPDRSNLGAELIKKPYRKRALARKIREVLAA